MGARDQESPLDPAKSTPGPLARRRHHEAALTGLLGQYCAGIGMVVVYKMQY